MSALLFLPDLLLIGLGFVVFAIDLLNAHDRGGHHAFHATWIGLLFIFAVLLLLPYDRDILYFSSYRIYGLGLLFRQVFTLSALCTVLLSQSYFVDNGNRRGILINRGEFYGIIIFCTVGMFTVVSATELLTLFIGMELATIPLYVLSAYQKGDARAAEASTKFIIMGALATGFAIFGYSLLYGCAGSLHFAAIAAFAAAHPHDPMLGLAVLFVLAGIGFKLTLFPFHMWAPDVYEGASTPVTAFLSVSSKAAAVGFLVSLLYGPFAPLHSQLRFPVLIAACFTMTVGNLGAMRQKNLRRFMAYSSIAQAGYILMAMAGIASFARAAIIYYLLVYAAANYATFFIISIVGRRQQETLASLRGLAKQSPALGIVLMLAMFSLAGIPPLAGFTGKFLLFASAAQGGYYFFVVFAALNSTISLYYYLLLLKEAYILQPAGENPPLQISFVQRSSILNLTMAMVLLGIVPFFSSAIMRIVG
jgi:NADH-quinone oxidoreductase subunit N